MRKRYKVHSQGREHLDRWLVSYADYMTLIFALFVVLYSVALVNKEQYRAVIDGMSQAFRVIPFASDGLLERQGDSLLERAGQAVTPILTETVALAPAQAPFSDMPTLQDGTTLAVLELQVEQGMRELLDADVVRLARDDQWLTIELSAGLLFGSGSAFLGANAAPILETLSAILAPVDNYVRVRGYTDNQQINNEIYRSNWALSAARAESVLHGLIGGGIAPQRLAFEAYGEFAPFADNSNEQGRVQNRKVVVAISKYAWVAPTAMATPVAMTSTVEPGPAGHKTLDASEIKIISLPGGGIRITTRQD